MARYKSTTLVKPQAVNTRRTRVPTTNYELKNRPWQVQPFACIPVLPGETLRKILWTDAAITDPLKSRFLGWWCETKFFYVRARDCFPAQTEAIKNVFIDPEASLQGVLGSAADAKYYHIYGVNWLKGAVEQIIEHYYRADDEAPSDHVIDGLFAASAGTDNWMDSLITGAEETAEDVAITVGVDDQITMSEISKAERMYEMLRMGLLTDMDYPDFLRTYGVRVPSEELQGKPRYLGGYNDWSMPTNTVEPTTGVPSSAVYWNNKDRHDKDFLVKEPGFIIALRTYRPKVFRAGQKGSVTGIMDTAYDWLPALLMDDPSSSLVRVASDQGPLGTTGQDYTFDLRDLFLYGEDFINFDPATYSGAIPLPVIDTADTPDDFNKRYPTLAMARQLFLDDGEAGTKQFIETCGRIDFTISGQIIDTTPSVSRLAV